MQSRKKRGCKQPRFFLDQRLSSVSDDELAYSFQTLSEAPDSALVLDESDEL
jgi:hypothetical protein